MAQLYNCNWSMTVVKEGSERKCLNLVSSDGYSYCVKVFTLNTPNSMPYWDNVATLSAYGRGQMLSLAL